MKTLVEFLNKTYDQKLENHKEYKKTLKEMPKKKRRKDSQQNGNAKCWRF